MRDEKRQTRLLPFRLRGAGGAREFKDARARDEESSADVELGALLRAWEAPAPSGDSRERLLSEFRSSVRRAPLWRRALSAELRVPLPVAACAALAVLAALFALTARTATGGINEAARPARESASAPEGVRAPEPAVKIVEVPVERERVVTRYVYVERGARTPAPQSLAGSSRYAPARANDSARDPLARAGAERQAARATRAADAGAQTSAEPASYYTRVDMEGFEPSDDMKMRIVRRGKTDEK